jgi:NitT/TauT family transport system ATP-binding protein
MRSGNSGSDEPPGRPPRLTLRGLGKSYPQPSGGERVVMENLDLVVEPGEFCVLIGPTGCGKSTALSLVSGLDRPSAGEILVDDTPLHGTDPRTGFVFQSDPVFPWKTVLNNVAAGPRFRGAGKKRATEQAQDWVRRVGLSGFEHHYPHQLSGGMRKRVALAQTFINSPRILLMDEPFSGLDAQTRQIMSDELLGLWESLHATVILVTHDLEEAVALADRVVVITAAPATVKKEFTVDLPRPRRVRDIRFQPRFVEIHEQIWSCLSEEVEIAYARAAVAA